LHGRFSQESGARETRTPSRVADAGIRAGSRGSSRTLPSGHLVEFRFALLQSFCSAVIAVSGLRVAIGLTSLAAAAGVDAPARGFHSDAIRIPMMALALLGALFNLYTLWNVRRLRNRPAAQWRRVPLTAKKKASERLQLILSIVTLVLLAAEWITHPLIHRVH
jgi:hypothetical protein